MDPTNKVDRQLANKQWEELISIYKDLGMQVSTITPISGLPDMVFAANGFVSIEKKAIVSRFRYLERQPENEYFNNWLVQNAFQVIDPGTIVYEGEGDTFLVKDTIYQGWGFRSDERISTIFKSAFPDKEVKLLHLVDDKFYHFDTCFFPVDEDLVYYYAPAFDDISNRLITSSFRRAYTITQQEAMSFSLNSIRHNDTVIINSHSKRFGERLRSVGFTIVYVDVSEFMKSGGSVKCLTNELYE